MNKLPNGWEYKKLDDLFKEFNEKNHADKIILASTQDRGVIPSDLLDRHIIRKKESLSNYKLVKKGCFVISLRSFQGGFEYSNYEGIISPAYTILEPKMELVDDFYKYYFKSYYFINKSLPKYAEGIRDGKQIKYKACKEILVPYPPLEEQKRIASGISKIDAYLENTIKLIEEKERFKKGIAKKLLTCKDGENVPEMRFKEFNDEWEIVKLGDLGIITATGVDKKIRDNEIPIKLLNYLDVFNRNKLYEKEISYMTTATEKQLEKCNIRKGDLFITPSSEDREGIAKSSVAMEDFHNTVYSYHIIRVRFNKEIDLKFKSYMCDTDFFHRQAYRLSDGMGQRYFISLNNFRNIEICIPKSIEEQKIIGEYLSLLDAEIDNLKEQKEEIKKMKSGIIKKLMTGEVRL